MCITEYDETKTMNMFREEGREEGKFLSILNILNSGAITITQAAGFAGMSISEFQKKDAAYFNVNLQYIISLSGVLLLAAFCKNSGDLFSFCLRKPIILQKHFSIYFRKVMFFA